MWLMPPTMKSQMTLLALGAKWGKPSGGARAGRVASARAMPSRWSIEERTSPVKPMPKSARKVRRDTPRATRDARGRFEFMARALERMVTKSLWLSSTWTTFSRARSRGSVAGLTVDAGPEANGVNFDWSANRAA